MTLLEAESAKCIAFVAFLIGPNATAVIFVVFIAVVIVYFAIVVNVVVVSIAVL